MIKYGNVSDFTLNYGFNWPSILVTYLILHLQIYWYRQGDLEPKFRNMIYYNSFTIVILCVCANLFIHIVDGCNSKHRWKIIIFVQVVFSLFTWTLTHTKLPSMAIDHHLLRSHASCEHGWICGSSQIHCVTRIIYFWSDFCWFWMSTKDVYM